MFWQSPHEVTPEHTKQMTVREKFLFMARCQAFWNMTFGNTKDKFIVWEHPT